MSIEAMKMALAKFEHLWEIGIDAVYKVELLPEIQTLRQAIEQAEKQEPQMIQIKDGHLSYIKKPWVGLTTEESSELYNKNYDKYDTDMTYMDFFTVQREVEAKLREKNGG
jgi:hypothetical protein